MQRLYLSVCFAAIAVTASASASPLDAASLMANYNLITSGNATTNGDIEGAMIVGGNFTGAAGTANLFNNAARLPANKTSYIYGANSSQINVDNAGSLYIGGSNSGNINLNGPGNLQIGGANSANINGSVGGTVAIAGANGGTVNNATYLPGNASTIVAPYVKADVIAALTGYSATLAGLSSNGSIITGANSLTFSHAGSGQAVFAIAAADLVADLTNANISFLLGDPSASVVINVDLQGANLALPSSAHFASGTALENVLFNFYNGTGTVIDFGTMWKTSVLAMGSEVTNHTPIEGSVAAASFTGHGELHNFPPTPPGNQNPPPETVPEPGTLALMMAAMLGLLGLRRKRKLA
ncbi:collagen-binding domain-containing protein [Rhizomicrobium electricum]|uniref:PEP-CTERM protein-sorting domain-containing protein n=1 Tax=Rhizomicrobium electricum TaxID=480070 RepID=A0ABP3Q6U1_9PROT|nr:collagen-binding domain-containing protein [Rhizomicrobium electricum]NIJ49339.1 choice-of-anchor A domain-containing protein [Rhizomicrobium electricum]